LTIRISVNRRRDGFRAIKANRSGVRAKPGKSFIARERTQFEGAARGVRVRRPNQARTPPKARPGAPRPRVFGAIEANRDHPWNFFNMSRLRSDRGSSRTAFPRDRTQFPGAERRRRGRFSARSNPISEGPGGGGDLGFRRDRTQFPRPAVPVDGRVGLAYDPGLELGHPAGPG
jgi:hypothetical protein